MKNQLCCSAVHSALFQAAEVMGGKQGGGFVFVGQQRRKCRWNAVRNHRILSFQFQFGFSFLIFSFSGQLLWKNQQKQCAALHHRILWFHFHHQTRFQFDPQPPSPIRFLGIIKLLSSMLNPLSFSLFWQFLNSLPALIVLAFVYWLRAPVERLKFN